MSGIHCFTCGATSDIIRPHNNDPKFTFCKECKIKMIKPSEGQSDHILFDVLRSLCANGLAERMPQYINSFISMSGPLPQEVADESRQLLKENGLYPQ